jgi:hypothetical protein
LVLDGLVAGAPINGAIRKGVTLIHPLIEILKLEHLKLVGVGHQLGNFADGDGRVDGVHRAMLEGTDDVFAPDLERVLLGAELLDGVDELVEHIFGIGAVRCHRGVDHGKVRLSGALLLVGPAYLLEIEEQPFVAPFLSEQGVEEACWWDGFVRRCLADVVE